MGWMYSDAISALKKAGYTDGPMFAAAHSLGGVMLQEWAQRRPDKVRGIAIMGSVLLRGKYSLNEDGTTNFDYDVPALAIGGTRDGLMRISRVAEAYWHGVKNVEPALAGKFPVVALEGVAHHSFMSAPYPSAVRNDDLSASVDEATAHSQVASAMVNFFHSLLTESKSEVFQGIQTSSD